MPVPNPERHDFGKTVPQENFPRDLVPAQMLEMTLRRDTGREKVMLTPTLVADFLAAAVRKRDLNRAWLPLGTKPPPRSHALPPSRALISGMSNAVFTELSTVGLTRG